MDRPRANRQIVPMFPELAANVDTEPSEVGSFTFIDLFAGIGGIRIGLTQVGGSCVYSCENDPFARKTYIANFGECEGEDVRDVVTEDVPDHDVLAAGFPCQPFSIAGVSKKLSLGREHGFQDEKSGNLFFEIVRVLEAKQPKAVFLENVKNLRTHDRGNTIRVILSELARVGYDMSMDVVDARHWVPQHRERTFLIGFRRDLYHGRRFEFPPLPQAEAPRLRSVLEPWYDRRYVLSEHLWNYLQDYKAKHQRAGNGFGYGLSGGDDVARTLSARYHKDGSEILIDTGSRVPRRLTPVECGLLMGFPNPEHGTPGLDHVIREPLEQFHIPVSDTQAYRQFGNAVVVPVIRHLGSALVKQAGFVRSALPEAVAG